MYDKKMSKTIPLPLIPLSNKISTGHPEGSPKNDQNIKNAKNMHQEIRSTRLIITTQKDKDTHIISPLKETQTILNQIKIVHIPSLDESRPNKNLSKIPEIKIQDEGTLPPIDVVGKGTSSSSASSSSSSFTSQLKNFIPNRNILQNLDSRQINSNQSNTSGSIGAGGTDGRGTLPNNIGDGRGTLPNNIGDGRGTPKIMIQNKYVNRRVQEDQLRDKILLLETSDNNKAIILKHYSNMKRSDQNTTEYYKNQIFVDSAINYPWNKYFDINTQITKFGVRDFLILLKEKLDAQICGMESVKNEIINVVCKFITNPKSNRNNIALYGPAGVGKSKFIKILSDILGLSMKTISLGGIKDSSFFLGHGYVYVESGPGKIIQNIIDSKISNPIMYFDELDKVSETDNGKDIFSFLCYLTDPTQNHEFSDHYFYGMEFDLSKVFYVFTFNDITKIDKILLDRLNIIKVHCPNEDDIINIIQNFCIPEILQNVGIQKVIKFQDSNINFIMNYCKDSINKTITSGIREYYRIMEKIILEINKDILLNSYKYVNNELLLNESSFQDFFNKIKEQLNYDTKENFPMHMYM
jgi:adenylate kinase family enzyme